MINGRYETGRSDSNLKPYYTILYPTPSTSRGPYLPNRSIRGSIAFRRLPVFPHSQDTFSRLRGR